VFKYQVGLIGVGTRYPPAGNPLAPPVLTHILGTRYMVDISPGIPTEDVEFITFGRFVTAFLQASTPDKTRYYALVRYHQMAAWSVVVVVVFLSENSLDVQNLIVIFPIFVFAVQHINTIGRQEV